MADIFLSYAREDRVRAEQVAHGLEGAGLDVFWDNEIPPGATWADHIEQKLTQCNALIVLWSKESVKSQWVREEARMGRDKGVLIPVMIDAVQAPFGFGEVQAADLSTWDGGQDHPGWRRFVDAVRQFAAAAPSAAPRPAMSPPAPPRAHARPAPEPQEKKKGVPTWAWVVGGIVATLVVLGIIGSTMDQSGTQQAAVTPDVQPAAANPAPAATPVAPGPAAAQNYQQQLLDRLGQVQQAFAPQGLQPMTQPFTGQLPQGQSMNVPVTLNAGAEYRIVGVCDNDCSDLDLILYDQNNNVISQDNATDALPIVSVTPQWSGPFTVQARMHACSVQPCYYALALYGRATQ